MEMIKEFQGEYRFLSNFAKVDITIDGLTYRSVEHAYISQKSDDIEWKNFCKIRGLKLCFQLPQRTRTCF